MTCRGSHYISARHPLGGAFFLGELAELSGFKDLVDKTSRVEGFRAQGFKANIAKLFPAFKL